MARRLSEDYYNGCDHDRKLSGEFPENSSCSQEISDSDIAKIKLIMKLRGIVSSDVIAALEKVPRIDFVDEVFSDRSYHDLALPISGGQTISQPSVVARMTEALDVDSRCKVLEIGTGSGYQAAVLSYLCRRVYTIERRPELARIARSRFDRMGLHKITVKMGDGSLGWSEQAPFDRIIVTAAAEDLPSALLDQLKVGGVMVIPIGDDVNGQVVVKVTKDLDKLTYEEIFPVRFVHLMPGIAED